MKTTTKLKLAWKYRRQLWKYRKLIQYRREILTIGAASLAVGALMYFSGRSGVGKTGISSREQAREIPEHEFA
jgi:hypothetical protein